MFDESLFDEIECFGRFLEENEVVHGRVRPRYFKSQLVKDDTAQRDFLDGNRFDIE